MKGTTSTHKPGSPVLLLERARDLRRDATEAERKLWSRLRNHGLGVKFRRQHAIGPFIVDFFCHQARLVVEIDGDRHDGDERGVDSNRSRYLAQRDYQVVRFQDDEVLGDIDSVLRRLTEFL